VEPVELVRAWTKAWNARDVDALAASADEAVALEMPGGTARGVVALRELVAGQSYGVRLYVGPQDLHVLGDTVISVGPIEFRQVEEDDRVVGREEDAAAVFVVNHDRIARFKPYTNLTAALAGEGHAPDALADASGDDTTAA
jgi:hypothetical protein